MPPANLPKYFNASGIEIYLLYGIETSCEYVRNHSLIFVYYGVWQVFEESQLFPLLYYKSVGRSLG